MSVLDDPVMSVFNLDLGREASSFIRYLLDYTTQDYRNT